MLKYDKEKSIVSSIQNSQFVHECSIDCLSESSLFHYFVYRNRSCLLDKVFLDISNHLNE